MDQYFSQTAALMARHEFDSADDVTKLLDSAHRPDDQPGELHRKNAKLKTMKVRSQTCKMDNIADWKAWVSALGLRLMGLRHLALWSRAFFSERFECWEGFQSQSKKIYLNKVCEHCQALETKDKLVNYDFACVKMLTHLHSAGALWKSTRRAIILIHRTS